jgi:hypothetical protein
MNFKNVAKMVLKIQKGKILILSNKSDIFCLFLQRPCDQNNIGY